MCLLCASAGISTRIRSPPSGEGAAVNAAAVGRDDVARDGEPEPGTAGGAAAGAVHAVEPLEQPRQRVRRHAGGGVVEVDGKSARSSRVRVTRSSPPRSV